MANARRGEIEAVIDGRAQVLCLTLGALAQLETAFAVDNLAGRRSVLRPENSPRAT